MIGLSDDKGDLHKLKFAFKELDTDHDGKISIKEIKNAKYDLIALGFTDDKWS